MVALALMITGCQSTPTTAKSAPAYSQAPVSPLGVTMVVHGMSCPLCATNVDKQLLRVHGVTGVFANLQDGRIDVAVNPTDPPTEAALAHAVIESGFTLVKIDESGASTTHPRTKE